MKHETINGVDCYGTAAPGMNYELVYDDEYRDGIATDITAVTWAGVIKQLNNNNLLDDLVQITAV